MRAQESSGRHTVPRHGAVEDAPCPLAANIRLTRVQDLDGPVLCAAWPAAAASRWWNSMLEEPSVVRVAT